MAFDYIKDDELGKTFRDATKFMLPLHQPFAEFERIARNRPHPGIHKDLPKVTDGTLASIIQDKPKRIIQQIPTGLIESEDKWLELVAGFILTGEILPNANEEAAFIQKVWAAVSKSMTYGSQPAFVKFINRGDYFGTDFVLPYIKDVLLEPGKVSDRASNVMFLRTWWSKNQVQALIEKEKLLSSRAKDRKEEYDSGWDLKMLSDLLEEGLSQKDVNAQTPYEKNKMLNAGFYEIVHCFQRGIGGQFYSFSPRMVDGENVLRRKTNPDPRGYIPIHFLYADQDLSNPLGRGAAEMSGGVQNLLDSEMQMYQHNRALMLNPPVKKWGSTSKASIKFVPNHIIEFNGTKETDDAEPMVIDNTALSNFPTNVQLMQSQIMRLNQSGDTASISADSGAAGMSKTPEGIKTRDQQLGVSDNHMRKQTESWLEEVLETQVNLYFAERHGVQELQLDDETAAKLNQLHPGVVSPEHKIRINYDSETPKLKFKVDPSSSSMQDDAQQLDALDNLLERYEKSAVLQQVVPPDKVINVWNRIVGVSGVEDAEKLSIEVGPDGKPKEDSAQPQQAQMTPEMVQQMIQEGIKQNDANDPANHPLVKVMDVLNIKFETLDAGTQTQLIEQIFQITPSGPTPSAQDMQLKTEAQAHQQQIEQANTAINAKKVELDIAKQKHLQGQSLADNALKGAQFQQSTDQANKSHTLAVKQANKPQPKAGATK